MKREMLVEVARMQLAEAHEFRRLAIKHRLDGNAGIAEAYRQRAATCLRCARLFMQDAHTERLETLRLGTAAQVPLQAQNEWKFVPLEPTEEMVEAGVEARWQRPTRNADNVREIYRAMIEHFPRVKKVTK